MAGNFGNRPPREKNGLDNRKLSMSTPTPGVQGKFARLDWAIINANPRLTVYTNDPNDPGEGGRISGAFDIVGFTAFILAFEDMIDKAPNGYKDKVDLKNFRYFGQGKKSERPEVISSLWFGKDDNGVVWISLVDSIKHDRPKIKFEFQNDWHQFVHGDGTPYTKAETSKAFAKGYCRLLPLMMGHMATVDYTPPEPKPQQGGGGGGGYGGGNRGGGNYGGGGGQGGGYNRGGQGGGGGAAADVPSDDIPF